ncbi:MAG: DUF3422 domain-containing protein [Steroidobacteraceae bacterium]|nr:DUF3422 domain-containing protein [Steroidobacteraceae bacterium]
MTNPDLKEHPARHALSDELHARPLVLLTPPQTVWCLTFLTEAAHEAAERDWLARFARAHEMNAPDPGAMHALLEGGGYLCKWERHTEFTNYVFFKPGLHADVTLATLEESLPGIALSELPGELFVATRLLVAPADGSATAQLPAEPVATESTVCGGRGRVRAGFRIERHGFSSIQLLVDGLSAREAGRLAQALLELECYRMMALLSLPLARDVHRFVTGAESELAQLTEDCLTSGAARDDELLARLVDLAARVERSVAGSQYRFSAADAYYAIVRQRVDGLEEAPVGELPTVAAFLDRRLAPAMRTCSSADARQEALSGRVSRTVDLLRTRVDVAAEAESKQILAALNKRLGLQLRLQQAVEAFSVAAITYYGSSLVGGLAKGADRLGLALDPELVGWLSIPVIAMVTWVLLRRLRRRLELEPS